MATARARGKRGWGRGGGVGTNSREPHSLTRSLCPADWVYEGWEGGVRSHPRASDLGSCQAGHAVHQDRTMGGHLGGSSGGAEGARIMSLSLINGIKQCIIQGSARETESARY